METHPYGIKDERTRHWVVGPMLAGDSGAAGLPGNPWPSLAEFVQLSRHVRRRLSLVQAPCLVVHSSEDDIASLRNVTLVQEGVSGPVETVLLDDSYHMVSVDRQRDIVVARSAAFFCAHRRAATGGRDGQSLPRSSSGQRMSARRVGGSADALWVHRRAHNPPSLDRP